MIVPADVKFLDGSVILKPKPNQFSVFHTPLNCQPEVAMQELTKTTNAQTN